MIPDIPKVVMISEEEVFAILRLYEKFHTETDCGADGVHWAECERVGEIFGAQ